MTNACPRCGKSIFAPNDNEWDKNNRDTCYNCNSDLRPFEPIMAKRKSNWPPKNATRASWLSRGSLFTYFGLFWGVFAIIMAWTDGVAEPAGFVQPVFFLFCFTLFGWFCDAALGFHDIEAERNEWGCLGAIIVVVAGFIIVPFLPEPMDFIKNQTEEEVYSAPSITTSDHDYSPSTSSSTPSSNNSDDYRSSTSSSMSNSNGYTWNRASYSEKMDICRRMARISTKGNTADFYYDAYENFYDSTDPFVLENSIDDMRVLFDAFGSE